MITKPALSENYGGITMSIDKESVSYISRLSETIKELAISKSDIASLLNKTEKTVSRYFANECAIKASDREKIDRFINERSVYGNYQHRSAEVFKDWFKKLYEEFKDDISQKELAEQVGLGGQSQISKVSSGEKHLTTKEQYDILSVFLRLCINQNANNDHCFNAENVFTKHYDTAGDLYCKLYGNTKLFEEFENDKKNGRSNFAIKLSLINYLVQLPYQAQELILNHPLAFFDSLQILYFDNFSECSRIGGDALYPSVSEFIDAFNSLPREKRILFQQRLEELTAEKKVFSYYDHKDNWKLFDIVNQYRMMISSARERRIADTTETAIRFGERLDGYKPIYCYVIDDLKDETKDKAFDKDKQFKRFESVIYDLIDFDRELYSVDELTNLIMYDIKKRLTMCPYEWYMWMLYASYVFAYQEDETIYDLLEDVEDGKYDHLADPMLK